jgi:hybrid cluster-associated redox disulfide protein
MTMEPFTPQTSVFDLLTRWPQAASVFLRHRMNCVGCSMSSFETLQDAAAIYGVALDQMINEIRQSIEGGPPTTYSKKPHEEMIMSDFTFFPDLVEAIDTIPTESIVSRTLFREEKMKVILFAFAPGQELSEHTASVPATIQILEGEGELTLGSSQFSVKAGAWAHLPARMPHSILARTPLKMLLMMLS